MYSLLGVALALIIAFARRYKKKNDLNIKSVYVIESGQHGSLPSAFESFFDSKNISITNQYTLGTDMIFCRGHDLRNGIMMKLTSHVKLTYGLSSGDFLANKQTLAVVSSSSRFLPTSFVSKTINNGKESNTVNPRVNDYCYIFKKNIQKQKGIQISCTQDEYDRIVTSNHDVIQEALLDPYTIDGRKINLRVYVMFVYDPILQVFQSPLVYEDGFIYYCKDKLPIECKHRDVLPHEITYDNFITTGYIDRSVYETNPLTVLDMLGEKNNEFFKKVRIAIEDVFVRTCVIQKAVEIESIADRWISSKGKRFLIFGVDLAVSRSFDIKIMEMNKGPDLNAKDGRDGELKKDMVKYMMSSLLA